MNEKTIIGYMLVFILGVFSHMYYLHLEAQATREHVNIGSIIIKEAMKLSVALIGLYIVIKTIAFAMAN